MMSAIAAVDLFATRARSTPTPRSLKRAEFSAVCWGVSLHAFPSSY